MARKISILLLGLFTVVAGKVFAQQDAQFSHFPFTQSYVNPGYVGIEGVHKVGLLARSQWTGWQPQGSGIDYGGTAPNTQMLGFEYYLKQYKSGLGINIVNDQLGPLRLLDAQFSVAHHINIKDGKLGVGVRVGIRSQRIDGGQLRPVDPTDPIYQELAFGGNDGQTKFDIGGGLIYKTKKYYGGIGFTHLAKSTFSFGTDDVINSDLANHLYIIGGYKIQLNSLLELMPNGIIQWDLNELTYDIGALLTYNDRFWAGLGFRQSFIDKEVNKGGKTFSNDAVILMVGAEVLQNKLGGDGSALRLGYAFDLVTSGTDAKKPTSHEIMATYILPFSLTPPQPKVRTPRYRHDD